MATRKRFCGGIIRNQAGGESTNGSKSFCKRIRRFEVCDGAVQILKHGMLYKLSSRIFVGNYRRCSHEVDISILIECKYPKRSCHRLSDLETMHKLSYVVSWAPDSCQLAKGKNFSQWWRPALNEIQCQNAILFQSWTGLLIPSAIWCYIEQSVTFHCLKKDKCMTVSGDISPSV